MDRVMSALGGTDGPWRARIAWARSQRIVRPFPKRLADRVDGREEATSKPIAAAASSRSCELSSVPDIHSWFSSSHLAP